MHFFLLFLVITLESLWLVEIPFALNGVSLSYSITVHSGYLSHSQRKIAVRHRLKAVLHILQLLTKCPLGSESTRSIRSRLECCWSRLMLYWRRLGHYSKFEIKCRPVLESTRLNLESTRQLSGDDFPFWRRLDLQDSKIILSILLPRVDSNFLGVDSALRAGKTGLLSLNLNYLGVDSDFAGVDSALRHRNTDLLSLELNCLGVDSDFAGVDSALRHEIPVFCLWS